MIAHRRRKKRPNYGIRTVEVARGLNGFGFTISGQQPCILSCIVTNSPADQAGLKAGDFLISVNGLSVSKVTHDAVVKLIGSSIGPIKLSIAEYYYSDSSDEESIDNFVPRSKPRYPYRPRAATHKTQKDMVNKKVTKIKEDYKKVSIVSPVKFTRPKLLSCPGYKALVGYLGTIEMPSSLKPTNRMHTVCSCIRKFRTEKRNPSTVVMMVLPSCITLTNAHDHTLAIYPSNRVIYINSSSEKESCYFGLVTMASNVETNENQEESYSLQSYSRYFENNNSSNRMWHCVEEKSEFHDSSITLIDELDVSNSCHVFVIDSKIADHQMHINKAQTFNIQCTKDVISNACLEFPKSAEYIVNLVQKMYNLPRTQPVEMKSPIKNIEPNDQIVANSPQPSASSNSDSGIGFRDDCGLVSDRILVVDFPAQPRIPNLLPQSPSRPIAIDGSSVAIDSLVQINNSQLQKLHEDSIYANDDPPKLERSKSSDDVFKTPSSEFTRLKVKNIGGQTPKAKRATFKSHEDLTHQSEPSLIEKNNFGSLQEFVFESSPYGKSFQMAVSEPDVRFRYGYVDDGCESTCSENAELLEDVNKNETTSVSDWAASLDKLLEDPKGRETFTEFLKKEFSAENIHFWTSCENYKIIESTSERLQEAQHIYNTHLCKGAIEPVNVDSQARNITQDALNKADPELFLQAQKQIFNLMKFDSYPRFLKSELYKKCLVMDDSRHNKSESDVHNSTKVTNNKLKKSLSNAEDRRRKSLLPWHRKNRSKSKDRGEMEYQKDKPDQSADDETKTGCSDEKDLYNSRTSLTSWDVNDDTRSIGENSSVSGGLNKNLFCRVILSDGATTVVQIRSSETIREMINRLLEKRGLNYSNFEVFFTNKSKPLDLSKDSTDLAGCEVVIEHRIVFKLDLPNRKIISVKSKPTKILTDVLRPILHKYGYKLELVRVLESAKCEHAMNINVPVTAVDGFRLCIQMDSPEIGNSMKEMPKSNPQSQSLDEITNKVFEELLQSKSECSRLPQMSDQGSIKSEDWGSEHSSGIFGRLLRRDSTTNEKRIKKALLNAVRNKGTSSHGSIEDVRSEYTIKKPLIAKWKPGIKLHVTHKTSESDELYEGLKRAQRSRLEDQRGTEINFELPDFLKDKENSDKNKRQQRISDNLRTDLTSKFYDYPESKNIPPQNHDRSPRYYNKRDERSLSTSPYYATSDEMSPTKLETTIVENNVPVKNYGEQLTPTYNNVLSPLKIADSEPPPLPPKPKVLPIKPSNWKKTPPVKDAKGKPTLYLDQPTSSFV